VRRILADPIPPHTHERSAAILTKWMTEDSRFRVLGCF